MTLVQTLALSTTTSFQEKSRRIINRTTNGDASETGIIRFLTPAIM